MNYLPIEKDSIPLKFAIQLLGTTYTFEFFYNSTGDFFTVNLYRGDKLIYAGWKIDYNVYLFGSRIEENVIMTNHPDVPKVLLLPFDPSGKAKRVGWKEWVDQVQIFILTEEEINAL